MALAIAYSRAAHGIEAPLVTIETHISGGIPSFAIVGMPETAVRESRDRVKSAIQHTYFEFPRRKIVVNLAPADLPKSGSRFDLPIALSVLAASGQIDQKKILQYEWAGELSLSGGLRPVGGILPFAMKTLEAGRAIGVSSENVDEAALLNNLEVYGASNLIDICAHIMGEQLIEPHVLKDRLVQSNYSIDVSDIKGQDQAKRVLEITASGEHSLLMSGPPGSGKSMLASRLPTILPQMTEKEGIAQAAIGSLSGRKFCRKTWLNRPFRLPHHSASSVALVGGGSPPKPGEISLSHHGVLFLDELPEFNRSVLEALREPMESGEVTISRANYQFTFPAKFQCIAAMNPCPCGFYGDKEIECRCTSEQIQRYQNKISGPMLDRFDLHLVIGRPSLEVLTGCETIPNQDVSSNLLQEKVNQVHELQHARQGCINSQLHGKALERYCKLGEAEIQFVHKAIRKLKLSARGYHRMLRVSRTVADLAGSKDIKVVHLGEALSYRRKF